MRPGAVEPVFPSASPTCTALVMDPWQQDPKLGCDTGPGLLLHAAVAQYPLEKGAVSDQPCPARTGCKPVRELTLEHRFPTWREAVIEPHVRRKERALGSFAKVLDRA